MDKELKPFSRRRFIGAGAALPAAMAAATSERPALLGPAERQRTVGDARLDVPKDADLHAAARVGVRARQPNHLRGHARKRARRRSTPGLSAPSDRC